jgi:hypothetical protein
MSASTETLINLRSLTGEARTVANQTVSAIRPRRYKNKYAYNVRVNKITALANVDFGGNYSFQLPAFKTLCGECFIEMTLPDLTAESNSTYRKHPMLHVVDRVTYRAGQKIYEFCPREELPIYLSRVRDEKMKTQLRALFDAGALARTGGTFILPLITPWSIWTTDKLSQPIKHGARGSGLWDAGLLADNLVIEIQFASKANATSSAAAATTNGADLGSVVLKWEEVVANAQTIQAMKAEVPKTHCIQEYTRLDNQAASDAAVTTYRVASLVSRAATTGFLFRARPAANDAQNLDCMEGNEHIKELVVRCDGREIFDSDQRSDQQRDYLNILNGNPGDVGVPKFAHFAFGNSHREYDASHISGLIKNGSCNELDLDLQVETGDDRVDIVAIHLRKFTFQNGTVKVSNAY